MENQDQFEKIEPGIWKPEKADDSIIGELLQKQENVGDNNSMAYYLKTAEGETLMVWGCAILDDRMSYISIGDTIKIVYKGKGKNKKGQQVNLYEVYRKKEEKKEETTEQQEATSE